MAFSQLFPLCTPRFGRGFESYAAFGMLLQLMVWAYLVGIVLALGAELNAFLASPADPLSALPSGPPNAPPNAPPVGLT